MSSTPFNATAVPSRAEGSPGHSRNCEASSADRRLRCTWPHGVDVENAQAGKWISLETATLFVNTIETIVDLVDNPYEVQRETRDPNDDYLIALARTHEADVIVSGDKDLLKWEPQSPPVVTPAQFENRDGTT